jgi:GT2 family glycosyltransferase
MPHKTSFDRARVSVIIVNWNTGAYLKRCILSLSKQIMPPGEVIIVDNASTDSSAVGLEECYPHVKVVRLDKNIGFAAANNLAARLVSEECKWLALLNPDAFLEPAWLNKMLSAAMAYPEYSFFASRLAQAANHEILDGEGDTMHACGLAWREGHGQAISQGAIEPREIFSPCAAAALYRRDALESVGGFDEDFFCYFEDVDLGFRLRLAGHRCLLVPDAVAYHVGSATTGGQHSDFAIYHGHRNLVWTYVKNMPGALFWLLLPTHIALNLVTIVWFSIRGKGRVILRAKYDALCGIPYMWKKRRDIQKNRKASAGEIWKALNKSILPRLSERFDRCL